MSLLSFIPSPAEGVWWIGPLPIRAYALCILLGIVVAIRWGTRRWVAAGGSATDVMDVAMWAVPSGIVGGRLYHVVTDWQMYFGENGRGFTAALRIWDGGLGIWGAIALGFAGAAYACHQRGIAVAQLADALAPGIAVAQAIGRFGNWFNQELFGSPTTQPWGLEISPANRPSGYESFATFHPTFLYEALWCVAVAGVLVLAQRVLKLAHGQVFALYVALYCTGRGWIEMLRIDSANHILGLRLNVFTSVLIFIGAVTWLIRSRQHSNLDKSGN